MQRITLDNFRVFGTPATFNLAPVTVLTGKNNSGKSSLIKAFLVLADYLEQDDQTVLRLDGRRGSRHRISDWLTLKNWDTPISSSLRIGYQSGEVQLTFVFGIDETKDNKKTELIPRLQQFLLEVPSFVPLNLVRISKSSNYQLEVHQALIDYLTASDKEKEHLRAMADYPRQMVETRNELERINSVFHSGMPLSSEDMSELPKLLEKRQQMQNRLQQLKSLIEEQQRSSGILFQAEVTVNSLLSSPTLGQIIQSGLEAYMQEHLPQDTTYTLNEIIGHYGLELDEFGNVNPDELRKAQDDWNERARHEQAQRTLRLSSDQSVRILNRFRDIIEQLFFTVEHLGANRTYQARLYLTGSGQATEINTVADSFQRLGRLKSKGAKAFLQRWLPRFGLGEQVYITPIENSAIRIEVQRDGRRVNLADMGFGAGQVLTLLLHLAALMQQHDSGRYAIHLRNRVKLVLIEEPEANLHPNYQSELAELFAEVAKSDYRINFILETHSEYLIRNIQVLVKGEGKTFTRKQLQIRNNQALFVDEPPLELFKVYYLDTPSEANGNKYGHEMRLRDDGAFLDKFGEGFLDEARKLAFKSM